MLHQEQPSSRVVIVGTVRLHRARALLEIDCNTNFVLKAVFPDARPEQLRLELPCGIPMASPPGIGAAKLSGSVIYRPFETIGIRDLDFCHDDYFLFILFMRPIVAPCPASATHSENGRLRGL
jgi:hypothetical protein